MCGAGMPVDDATVLASDTAALREFLRNRHQTLCENNPQVKQAIDSADSFFTWPMTNVRATDSRTL